MARAAIEPWYMTGLVEFAGSFTYSRTDRNVVPYFALKVGDDEAGVLEDVQAYFGGVGRIYFQGSTARAARGGTIIAGRSRASRYYRVTRIEALDLIVSHFDEFPLRGRKAAVYAIWRELVLLKRDRYRKPDRRKLDELCATISATSRGGSRA